MAKRYFEFVEGTSSKFWEVWVEGNEVRTRYGKIGAAGQTTIKDEGSPAGAQKLHDKLVKEKTGKGYAEKAAAGAAPPAAPAAAPKPAVKAAPEPKVAAKAAPPPAPIAAVATEPAAGGARRWENTEDGASKFWEIAVEGASHTVRFGKIGTEGQSKTKDFDEEFEAEEDAEKLIAEKTKKGYRPVGNHATGPDLGPTNPELEAAIEKNLDDPTGYLVYADWLSAQGEPRGELIVLQHQGLKDEAKAKAAAALITKQKAKLLGELAEFGDGEKELKLEWHLGFIKSAELKWPMYDEDGGGTRAAAKELAKFLALPSARFLRKLELGPVPSEDQMSFQKLIDVIAKQPPATLEEVFIGDNGDWDISGVDTGDFDAVAAVCPRLKKVTLRAGNVGFGKNVELPELTELVIETGGLGQQTLKEICAMKAPKLERLSIWTGDDNYGGDCTLKDFAPILAGTGFPKLKHLGIMNCTFVNEAVEALPKSKVLKQLTSLDLSKGCLTDKSIDAMIASNAFGHLAHLNLDDNGLTEASKPKVKVLAKEVNFGTEQDPERAGEDHYRYCSVGE